MNRDQISTYSTSHLCFREKVVLKSLLILSTSTDWIEMSAFNLNINIKNEY